MLAHTTKRLHTLRTTVPVSFARLQNHSSWHELRVGQIIYTPEQEFDIASDMFHSLAHLHLMEIAPPSRPTTRSLISSCSGSYLQTCTLAFTPETIMPPHHFYTIIEQLAPLTGLKDLTVAFSYNVELAYSLEESTRLFTAFHSLSNLENLQVMIKRPFKFDSTIVSDVLRVCPRLRTWRLRTDRSSITGLYSFSSTRCFTSFESFFDLLQCHPHVRELPLGISTAVPGFHSPEDIYRYNTHNYGPELVFESSVDTDQLKEIVLALLPRVNRFRLVFPNNGYLSTFTIPLVNYSPREQTNTFNAPSSILTRRFLHGMAKAAKLVKSFKSAFVKR
jgi:hypothetical protein